mmetsp:Transcript_29265/g.47156  ORF Transcript_29265/g.47156 Transcript_29265/m.47156 type:complete len:254 (-) Transcript_29265:97-858(-)
MTGCAKSSDKHIRVLSLHFKENSKVCVPRRSLRTQPSDTRSTTRVSQCFSHSSERRQFLFYYNACRNIPYRFLRFDIPEVDISRANVTDLFPVFIVGAHDIDGVRLHIEQSVFISFLTGVRQIFIPPLSFLRNDWVICCPDLVNALLLQFTLECRPMRLLLLLHFLNSLQHATFRPAYRAASRFHRRLWHQEGVYLLCATFARLSNGFFWRVFRTSRLHADGRRARVAQTHCRKCRRGKRTQILAKGQCAAKH